jgi:hypothetical protein
MRVCDQPYACVAERDRVMRLPSLYTWNNPCTSCKLGTERKMAAWKPEPDLEPKPLRDAGKPSLPVTLGPCSVCGKTVTTPGAAAHRACLDSTRTKTKEPKPERGRTRCRNGHLLEKYGTPRNDGGVRCRICASARKHAAYQRKKEARV